MYIINGLLTPELYDIYVVKNRQTQEILEIRSTRYDEKKYLLLKEIKTGPVHLIMPNGDLFISGAKKKATVSDMVAVTMEAIKAEEKAKLEVLADEKAKKEKETEEKGLTALEKVQAMFPLSEDKIRKTKKEELVALAVSIGLDKAATNSLETKKLVIEKIEEKLAENTEKVV